VPAQRYADRNRRESGVRTITIGNSPLEIRDACIRRTTSAAAGQPLWWPPAKIAGRYLGPFLATARPQPLSSEPLTDRIGVSGAPLAQSEYQDALELALMLADCDARWGDYGAALNALDAAEALQGVLPAEYEAKRREWRAAKPVP